MRYDAYYFSINDSPTIVPKQADVQIDRREKLSSIDVAEVRQFYGCTGLNYLSLVCSLCLFKIYNPTIKNKYLSIDIYIFN
jgi:hypothetical protein